MPQAAPQPSVEPPPAAEERSAYVKPVREEGETVYALFTADGRLVGIAPTRALALLGARRAALEPVDAH